MIKILSYSYRCRVCYKQDREGHPAENSGGNRNSNAMVFEIDIGSADPVKVAETIFDHRVCVLCFHFQPHVSFTELHISILQKTDAIDLLVLQASESCTGYLAGSGNDGFYIAVARDLLRRNVHMLREFRDDADRNRFSESVVQCLASLLPTLFANSVRKPILNAFSRLVRCDNSGYHGQYNAAQYPDVTLDDPLVGTEFRIGDGDPYGQESYRSLLEKMFDSFFPTDNTNEFADSRDAPLHTLTRNCLAFVEFLVRVTISLSCGLGSFSFAVMSCFVFGESLSCIQSQ